MEKLYNNVIFNDKFGISDPQDVPYLKEPPEVIDVTVGRQLYSFGFADINGDFGGACAAGCYEV